MTIFCLKKYISPFILAFIFKKIFTGDRIWDWQYFFFFSTLKMSCHCLLTCTVSDEMCMISYLCSSICTVSFFPPLASFQCCSIYPLVFSNLTVLKWFSLGLSYLGFIELFGFIFHNNWNFCRYFFNYFSAYSCVSFPFGTPITCMLVCLILSHSINHWVFLFLQFFYILCFRLDSFVMSSNALILFCNLICY